MSDQLHAQVTLWLGKVTWYPLDRRLGRSQGEFEHCGKEKNLCPFYKTNPYSVAITTNKLVWNCGGGVSTTITTTAIATTQ